MNASGSFVSVGNYRLSTTLGVGSFGKVKLAEHIITGHQVAIKILNKEKVATLKMDKKLRREIQIMKLFRHPHIIKLYEVIETDKDILLIMEYVGGGELFEHIVDHGKMPEEKARRFFQQIIAAVAYCHAHMIVHRDLKPENLLLDQVNGSVKIADFGLSNVMEFGAFLKTSCGSPNYAAPEVISGNLYAGAEVDVWSTGVILYALVCARLPFDNDHIPTLFKAIRAGLYSAPSCGPECADLIKRCLTVDPLLRITIPEIYQHSWFVVDLPSYLGESPVDVGSRGALPIDDQVVAELQSRLGDDAASYTEIVRALQDAAVPSTDVPALDSDPSLQELHQHAQQRTVNPLVVAYNLIYDQRYAQDRTPVSSPQKSSLLQMAASPPMNLRLARPFVDVGGASSLSSRPFVGESISASLSQSPMTDDMIFSAKHMWFLGRMSYLEPVAIMKEVYRVLTRFGFVWKVISLYSLRCRSPDREVKLSLQLYKLSTQKHLLDFKKIEGPQFAFFDCAAVIANTLQI